MMMTDKKNNGSKIILDLSIDNGSFDFATSIDDAMMQAEAEMIALNETVDSIQTMKPDCDKLDYILAASSGALCGVIDLFLVGKPGESPIGEITDRWFADRTKGFANMLGWECKVKDPQDPEKVMASAVRFLEDKFGVPYDQTSPGAAAKEVFKLSAANHHFKSLAHNPSLFGLFFSILNQFTNTSHFVSGGQLLSLQKAKDGWELYGNNIPSKLFSGFVNWFGHLMSDISGSVNSAYKGNRGMGIPSPLWTWTNDIIAIKNQLNLNVNDTDIAMNELALNIFEQGYDTRFQTAQAIPVFLNEILVRFIYTVRRMFRYLSETPKDERSFRLMWKCCEPFTNATVKRMLTVAHGTFCLIDVGDAVGRSLVTGGGTFNVLEFVLRLNVVGVGRFAISLYGETKRAISYSNAKKEADFASKEIVIVENYIEGLKILSARYDDTQLMTFIVDFQKSSAYIEAFGKSAELAKLRSVPTSKILKSKADIDKYFGG